jgi:hypothetical protein
VPSKIAMPVQLAMIQSQRRQRLLSDTAYMAQNRTPGLSPRRENAAKRRFAAANGLFRTARPGILVA